MTRAVIYRNSAKCLRCGEEIESRHRHDYKECKCKSIFVDGGLSYIRRNSNPQIDTSLTDDNTFLEIREGFSWGSYGRNGDEDLHYIKLKDLTEEHIINILATITSDDLKCLFYSELDYRRLYKIKEK